MRRQVVTIKLELYGTHENVSQLFDDILPIAIRLGIKVKEIKINEVTKDETNPS